MLSQSTKGVIYAAIATSSFILQLVLQISSGLLAPLLDEQFNLGPFFGNLLISSIFFLHIIMQVPAGILVDRFGPRLVLGVGAMICAVGGVCFSHAETFKQAIFFRIVMGAGLSCSFVSMASLISSWLKSSWFSSAISLSEMVSLSVIAYVEYSLGYHAMSISWRAFYFNASICAFVLSLVALTVVRDSPVILKVKFSLKKQWQHLRGIVSNQLFWLNGFYSGALFGIHTGFIASDAPVMLDSMPGINLATSGQLCALILLFSVFSAALVAWIAMRYQDIKPAMLWLNVVVLVAMTAFIWLPPNYLALRYVMAMLMGLGSGGYLLSFSLVHQYAKRESRGMLVGFTNMLSVLVGPVLSVLSGLILRSILLLKGKDMQADILFQSYQISSSIFPVFLVLSVVAIMRIIRFERSTKRGIS